MRAMSLWDLRDCSLARRAAENCRDGVLIHELSFCLTENRETKCKWKFLWCQFLFTSRKSQWQIIIAAGAGFAAPYIRHCTVEINLRKI